MSYTSAELVSHHLIVPFPIQEQIVDQALTLAGVEYILFFGGAVDSTTIKVKSISSNVPTRAVCTLESGGIVFSSQPVVRGSVVVASDSSLGTVYTENLDYVVDYAAGSLTTKSGGAIGQSQQITLWYIPFTLYEQGSDYSLRSDQGLVRRLNGGSIASGETVFLDYTPVYASFTDEIVNNAVTLANGLVEKEIDPEREFETDPTLGAAATYRALEIICGAAASRELASLRGQDRTATAWMKLADDYATKSNKLLSAFRPPHTNPRAPVGSRRRSV
ncbi:MAG: hypothetical protein DRP45_10970 [Candidatus Zixiibacteriota bacterium]|nr:MAG: hypothetical protein DRP45_10970 [candidate division Zixibacteria bacterium]